MEALFHPFMLPSVMPPSAFNYAAHEVLQGICAELSGRTKTPVRLEYGQTECGQYQDVVLYVDELPPGSWGRPGALISIVAGPELNGFTVLSPDGRDAVEQLELWQIPTVATIRALNSYLDMSEGALKSKSADARQSARSLADR